MIYLQSQIVLENSRHLQTLDLTKLLMQPANLNMGTISGKTHTKLIFIFSSDFGKYFIGHALIHILHLLYNQYLLQSPPLQKNSRDESNLESEWTRSESPSSNPYLRKLRVYKDTNTTDVQWCTICLQGCDEK